VKIGDLVRVRGVMRLGRYQQYLSIGWVVGVPPHDSEGMHLFPYVEVYFVSGQKTSMLIENLEVVATI
jgi:hypothetical protein